MPELKLVNGGQQLDPETLKTLKRLKRLKRKAKLQDRISAKPHKDSQQAKGAKVLSSRKSEKTWQQRLSVWLGIAMMLTGIAIIARNAWNQGDNDTDRWIALCRDVIPEIALYIMFGLALVLWNKANKLMACIAVLTGCCLYYVAYQNFDQWSVTTTANANQERISNRQKELETQYDVPTLKQRYDDAKASEGQIKTARKLQCDRNDGNKCQEFDKKTIPAAIKRTETAWSAYDAARNKAKEQAEREVAPIADKSTEAVSYRKLLPLLGSILIMLGSV